MNVARFLDHWSITENPFKAEEARHDSVFARLSAAAMHPDFEKIAGDLFRPAAAIVFGEKGSGKTAIHMQLAGRVVSHNERHPDAKVLLVAYDDLNPVLDQLVARVKGSDDGDGKAMLAKLKEVRLADHLDGILHAAVPRVVDMILGEGVAAAGAEPGWRALRKSPASVKREAQLLQALYDRQDGYEWRAAALRRRIHAPINRHRLVWKGLALLGWIPAAAIGAASFFVPKDVVPPMWMLYAFLGGLALWGLLLFNWFVMERWWGMRHLARRISRRLRVVPRRADALARVLEHLPPQDRHTGLLPIADTDSDRYAMAGRLRRVIAPMGFKGIIVLVDRIDEPTVISGDADRMRAVAWPLLNNKFLQQEGVGVKLLLPVELRHELFRESSAFFQEARLDKQNLIERLVWSGPSLYDLCNARVRACRPAGAGAFTLTDLFEEDVSRQDLVDALEQMHQPRDAFKLLYQCVQEHCAGVTEEQERWRIPRLVLDHVRKQQAERVQMVQRGYRPG